MVNVAKIGQVIKRYAVPISAGVGAIGGGVLVNTLNGGNNPTPQNSSQTQTPTYTYTYNPSSYNYTPVLTTYNVTSGGNSIIGTSTDVGTTTDQTSTSRQSAEQTSEQTGGQSTATSMLLPALAIAGLSVVAGIVVFNSK